MNLFTFNFNKLPKSFPLALIIIFSFEVMSLFLGKSFHLVTSLTSIDMEVKNKLSCNAKNSFDVLVLGDCFNLTGIIPKIIESKTGLSCFNFSTYFNSTILSQYCFFKNYLKSHQTKPKFIIIGFKPMSLTCSKEQIETRFIHYFYHFQEGNIDTLLGEFGLGYTIKFFVPSLKFQSFFKNFIHNPRFITQLLNKEEINNYIDKLIYVNEGFTEVDGIYDGDLKEIGGIHEKFLVTPFFHKYLTEILNIAKKNNLIIIYLIPTAPPDVCQIDKKNRITEQYINFVNSFGRDYNDLIIMHPQEILNTNDLYSSISHLNGKGAQILSELLSAKINKLIFNN